MNIRNFRNTMATAALLVFSAGLALAQEKVLYSFGTNANDGFQAEPGLISDANGNLYGTTNAGGEFGASLSGGGTAFELSPAAGGGWTEKVLYSFAATSLDGAAPYGGLVFDSKGNLYGTTQLGGTNGGGFGDGTVFELSPASGGKWSEKILYNFGASATDGFSPVGSLTMDAKGNLYGVTQQGGVHGGKLPVGGTVFELSPASGGTWTEKILYSFGATTTDGEYPSTGVTLDARGNVYGVTSKGGSNGAASGGDGTAFELSPGSGGAWTEKILYNFGANSTDGIGPAASLLLDAAGNLYGTTGGGGLHGTAANPNSAGTAFELQPSASGSWTEKILHDFGANSADGTGPFNGLTFDPLGNLFGATFRGGTGTDDGVSTGGVVFKLVPTAVGAWTETILHEFGVTAGDGVHPVSVLLDAAGDLFGTTYYGGPKNLDAGTVFEIPATAAALPEFTPVAGPYTASQMVKITDGTPDATIYYTLDGTNPTVKSSQYATPIEVAASETIKALATATGLKNSPIATAEYLIAETAEPPAFSQPTGPYDGPQSITLSDATPGAVIHYTITGVAPTATSAVYAAPIKVAKNETLEAIAIAPGYFNSPVASATYTILTPAPTPTFTPTAGTYLGAQTVAIKDARAGAATYYTLGGATPTTASTPYTGPISVTASETIEAIATATGYGQSAVAVGSFVINPNAGTITTVAGNGVANEAGSGGLATKAELNAPFGLAFDSAGNLYVSDFFGCVVRRVTPAGIITTIAGTGTRGYNGDNIPATTAELNHPQGLIFDAKGNLYITDGGGSRIRVVNSAGMISTIAGIGNPGGYNGDGSAATAAQLGYPGAIAFDSKGNYYIADYSNNRIRMVNAAGIISTIAGSNTPGFTGFNGAPAATAELNGPEGIAVDSADNIYFTESNNNAVRKITPSRKIYAVAGNGTAGYSGDGKAATLAELNGPNLLHIDSRGNLLIGDSFNNVIRMVNPAGIITTIAGNGVGSYSGDGKAAPNAELDVPTDAIEDTSGNIYLADFSNNRVRKVTYLPAPTPTISPAAGTYTTAQTVTITDTAPLATIFYTTDGSAPTTASKKYATGFKVSAKETITAIAVGPGFSASPAASAAYTIP